MRYSFTLRSQHPLIFYKNLRCLQSFTKITWEDRGLVKMTKEGQLLQANKQFKFLSRRVNEEKKEKSPEEEFLKTLYTTERDKQSQESIEVSKREYFTQAWLRKKSYYQEIYEQKSKGGADEHTSKASQVSSKAFPENTFGLIGKSTASSDHRDPNER